MSFQFSYVKGCIKIMHFLIHSIRQLFIPVCQFTQAVCSMQIQHQAQNISISNFTQIAFFCFVAVVRWLHGETNRCLDQITCWFFSNCFCSQRNGLFAFRFRFRWPDGWEIVIAAKIAVPLIRRWLKIISQSIFFTALKWYLLSQVDQQARRGPREFLHRSDDNKVSSFAIPIGGRWGRRRWSTPTPEEVSACDLHPDAPRRRGQTVDREKAQTKVKVFAKRIGDWWVYGKQQKFQICPQTLFEHVLLVLFSFGVGYCVNKWPHNSIKAEVRLSMFRVFIVFQFKSCQKAIQDRTVWKWPQTTSGSSGPTPQDQVLNHEVFQDQHRLESLRHSVCW